MIIKPNTGIDISHWQKGIKIANLTPRPRFAIIKASEGTNYSDDTTIDFSSQIRDLGIPLGFYHFWRNDDPVAQADLYIRQVNLSGGMERIPPVLDLEVDLTGQASNVKSWLDRVELITGKRPILYGNKGIFSKLGDPKWFVFYDVWTASYPSSPDNWHWVPPTYSVTAGRREVMWQYAATYAYPDSYPDRKIDTNIASPVFLNEIGEVGKVIPSHTGETVTIIGTAKSDTHKLTIRNTHQVSGSTSKGSVPMGVTVSVTETWESSTSTSANSINDVWALIIYGGITGWVGLKHFGKVYGNFTMRDAVKYRTKAK